MGEATVGIQKICGNYVAIAPEASLSHWIWDITMRLVDFCFGNFLFYDKKCPTKFRLFFLFILFFFSLIHFLRWSRRLSHSFFYCDNSCKCFVEQNNKGKKLEILRCFLIQILKNFSQCFTQVKYLLYFDSKRN